MRLNDKVAVVTGAGSGFGKAIAETYAREGARIVVNDLNADAANTVADAINAAGGDAVVAAGDVSRGEAMRTIIDAATTAYDRLDIVVNNAGYSHRNRPMLEVDEAEFDQVYAVNVKSIYWSAVHAVPIFRAQGHGNFINIASTAGLRPRPGLTWYNGSKAAAIVMSKSMAVELGPDKIRVNAICPVIGETGLLETFMGVPDTPENRARFIATIPMGRMSKPADIAGAALYLASDEAAFISGTALEVDGGRCV